MKFSPKFYLTAITFISTSILVQSFGQLVLPNDPRTDGDPTKKLSLKNLKHSSKANTDNGITSVLGEPLFDASPVKNMVTANTGQSYQASGDNAVGPHLILKRDIAAKNAKDEEYMEHQKTGSENWKSGSFIHKRNPPADEDDQSEEVKLEIYEGDIKNQTVSIRLGPLDLVPDGVESYYVLIVIAARMVHYEKTFAVAEDLSCKLWDNALCLQNLSIKDLRWFGVEKNKIMVHTKYR